MKKISHKKAQNSQIGIFCEFCAFLWLILFFVAALCFAQQLFPLSRESSKDTPQTASFEDSTDDCTRERI